MPDNLDFGGLCVRIDYDLVPVLAAHKGAAEFAKHRARFENWMKCELCGMFAGRGYDVVPEESRTDLVVSGWRIELKTVPTNYSHKNAIPKNMNITDSVDAVVADIEKLKTSSLPNKAVVFVAYPLKHEHGKWHNIHLPKIAKNLSLLHYTEFTFKNDIPGVLYIGKPGETQAHCFDKP